MRTYDTCSDSQLPRCTYASLVDVCQQLVRSVCKLARPSVRASQQACLRHPLCCTHAPCFSPSMPLLSCQSFGSSTWCMHSLRLMAELPTELRIFLPAFCSDTDAATSAPGSSLGSLSRLTATLGVASVIALCVGTWAHVFKPNATVAQQPYAAKMAEVLRRHLCASYNCCIALQARCPWVSAHSASPRLCVPRHRSEAAMVATYNVLRSSTAQPDNRCLLAGLFRAFPSPASPVCRLQSA